MTSNRPYLIRAMFDWIVDNGMTPHLLVDAEVQGVVVPQRFVEDGRIVLNVAPSAVAGMVLGNDEIQFSARFGGTPHRIELPTRAVLGIFARENSHGMLFPDDADGEPDADTVDDSDRRSPEGKRAGPSPRLVGMAGGQAAAGGGDAGQGASTKAQTGSKPDAKPGPKPGPKPNQQSAKPGPKPDSPGPKPGGKPGRPSLKIVK